MDFSFHTIRQAALAALVAARLLLNPSPAQAQSPIPSALPPASLDNAPPPVPPGVPLPPLTPVPPTAPALPPGSCPSCGCQASSGFDWSKVPDLAPVPRPGWFLLPPTGCGYYTALDQLRGNARESTPENPYNPIPYGSIPTNLNFNNDFRYLDKPGGEPVDFFDTLKRMHLGDDWMLSIGGEERLRIVNEIDSRLTAKNNDYQLLRSRIYADLWYRDLFRVYVEYLDAQSYNQALTPLAIDVNHSDLLDAFIDVKLGTLADHPLYARVGRQELLYGSQRLISPLDWANTRRTFEGAKVFWHSDDLDVDAFWTRPVLVSPGHFDAADHNVQFAGAWLTYRPAKGQAIDAYWLYLDSDTPVVRGRTTGGRFGFDLNTSGARWSGDHKMSDLVARLTGNDPGWQGKLLWDVEGAYQFGDYSNRLVVAGMSTTGLGYAFMGLPMQPQFWAYYDYASGTPNPDGTGTWETFNQQFPFGHYYFGYLDVVGRENIHDLNFQASFYPENWITCIAQYHVFRLDQAKDALYGPSPGYPALRRDPTGAAGTNVGDELDLLATFQLGRHSTLQVGFSKLFSGDFIKQTGPNVNPELYYVQYYFRW
jgi:hypothetical protein